jgi:hypothetical protein
MNELVQISSISAFIDLAKKYPLLVNLPAMSALKDIVTAEQPKKGCGCSAGFKQANELNTYRPMFEAGMSMLSDQDKESFKNILNAKKICYFIKDTKGQIKKYCF